MALEVKLGSRRFCAAAPALAFAVMATAVMPQVSEASQFRRINDVNVSCTDALQCDLYISNPRVALFAVGFRREAAFEAPLSLYLTLREALAAGSQVLFLIDGNPVLTLPASDFSYRAAISEYIYRSEDEVTALYLAAERGNQLQVVYRTRSGQSTAPFSLEGLETGASFMDDVQGRSGRDDALIALGGEPADLGESETAALETMNDGTEPEFLDQLPAPLRIYYEGEAAPCADTGGVPPDMAGGFSAELDNGAMLVGLRCGLAGAYNFPFAFWEQSDGHYQRLALPVMTDGGPAAADVAWNPVWDEDTGELTSFFRGRGIGDCGTFYRWQHVDADDVSGFVLREMRVKEECDGELDETMQSWDQLWPPAPDRS